MEPTTFRAGTIDIDGQRLLITQADFERLQELIVEARRWEPRGNEYLRRLEQEMEAAHTVLPSEIPADTVTMNSKVRLLDLDSGETMELSLVYPEDADADAARISVLAPIGTAVLGTRAGDKISWPVPDGLRRLKVVQVLYQPEAAGDETL
jgi:regulator of nucleoside diphosphate kinase